MTKPEKPTEILNSIIEYTVLGGDYGYMSYVLGLKTPTGCQGFGTYDLRFFGIETIERILNVVGVDNWEDLVGKHVRFERDHAGISKIGHILEDRWYDPEQHAKQIKLRKTAELLRSDEAASNALIVELG